MSLRPGEGYNPEIYAELASIEENHFWFTSRARVITTLARSHSREWAPGYRILEIGCGSGNLLPRLAQACPGGTVMGTDLFIEGLHHAAQRSSCPLLVSKLPNCPFRDGSFRFIGLFDVLEHLKDDAEVMRAVERLLAPGGLVMITVPAHQALWSYADEVAHHERRYSVHSLELVLRNAGLHLEFLSYFMCATLPLVWLRRRMPVPGAGKSAMERFRSELNVQPAVNALLGSVLSWEANWMAAGRKLPGGSSLIAVARRL